MKAETKNAAHMGRRLSYRDKTYCVADAGTGVEAGAAASDTGVAGKAGFTTMGADADGVGLSCASLRSEYDFDS